MDFILDLQDLETPEAASNAMASGGSSSGGGGSTSASGLSLLGCGAHSTVSLVIC
ncbi:SapB/AmfS family lanthipeptide [Actinosynnema sp. NPDC059335]|uniref:SapB/AmfS family lanthipeptide n=1 Tax=Actinosynnema sp. NPDC059335 TaxID=3346804 RepID=UPI00366E98FF